MARGRTGFVAHLALGALLAAIQAPAPASAEIFLWIDEDGHTHATNDPDEVPPEARRQSEDSLQFSHLWQGDWSGPPVADPTGDSSSGDGRLGRILRGAVRDLERGESARAAAALESVLRHAPGRPEAHWYLALLDRQRGRLESAEKHLEAFLAHAGDEYDDWRVSAQRRLRTLRDEARLATLGTELELIALRSPHFKIRYDANLSSAQPDYPRTVSRYLEEAYRHGERRLGVVPSESTGVILYAKAALDGGSPNSRIPKNVTRYTSSLHNSRSLPIIKR